MARELIASDNFNRADENPLSGGGNWALLTDANFNNIKVASNHIESINAHATVEAVYRWVGAGSFTDNQYAKMAVGGGLGAFGAEYQAGVVCRASGDTEANRDYYAYYFNLDGASPFNTLLVKIVHGTETTLDSGDVAWADGDTIEIEAEGTTIRGLRNGSVVHTATDSALTTGKPGIWLSGTTVPTGDNWEGGKLTAASDPSLELQGAMLVG